MNPGVIERRQSRRVDLQEGHVELRSLERGKSASAVVTGRTKDVSLAGCKALMPAPFPFPLGTPVSCSVSIPQSVTKSFPFVRVVAKGWVVRVLGPHASPSEAGSRRRGDAKDAGEPEVAVAIAFTDVTALSTTGGY